MLRGMDEGLPIAYEVLENDVPVYASDGTVVGTVDHVVAAFEQDIFHGIVIRTDQGRRFVAADDVVSLHERGVDLDIDATEAAALPEPEGAAPAWRDNEPGVKPSEWRHLLGYFTPHGDRSGWTREN
jgi:sporulation protein YlmC with PRC-barrel domain